MVIAGLLLSACATHGVQQSFAASNNLVNNTATVIADVALGRDFCDDIRVISTRAFQSTSADNKPDNLAAEEIWLVDQCGLRKEYEVFFTTTIDQQYSVGVKVHR